MVSRWKPRSEKLPNVISPHADADAALKGCDQRLYGS
jgi:hypothetical protein